MTVEFPAVNLVRYAQRIRYRECAFHGIHLDSDDDFECRRVWIQAERDDVAFALAEAQEEIEQVVMFALAPRWFEERVPYKPILKARQRLVIEPGIMKDTMLSAGQAVVTGGGDPASIGPIALGTCAAADVKLFHAGTDQEITPASYTEAGGAITFLVPFCRLVDPAFQDNPASGWQYTDFATWIAATVDVRCISNDPSVQGTYIWREDKTGCCSPYVCPKCGHTTDSACLYVRDGRLGYLDSRRATYASGAWTAGSGCGYCTPDWVTLRYRAGMVPTSKQAEDAVIRLAHSKMPDEPCGCDSTQRLWKRDRNTPTVLTAERANCPLGIMDGAWIAWKFANAMRILRGSTI
jgi:hypothetical protein